MTDTAAPSAAAEDKVLPAVVYGLFLFSVPSVFLTLFLGLIIAYVARGSAGPIMATHYTFQIASFWKSIWWRVIAILLLVFGAPLLLVGIGFLMMPLGWLIWVTVEIWFVVRCVVGLIRLFKGEAYPNPQAWLI